MKRIKKAISPLIATVLLISLVIVMALLIGLWARGFLRERITKFGSPIESACDKVDFEASLVEKKPFFEITVHNIGSEVWIYKIALKASAEGEEEIKSFFLNSGVGPGDVITTELSSDEFDIEVGIIEKIYAMPIILGTKGERESVEYACENKEKVVFEK